MARNDSTKCYVVLGCGGFIGSHLLDRLLVRDGVKIEGFDPDSHKIAHHLNNPRLNLHRNYLNDATVSDLLEETIRGADAVINLAAICNPAQYNTRPLATIHSNFIDAFPIAEMCAKHGTWLIHFSTCEVYGRTIASYVPGNEYDDPNLFEMHEDRSPQVMGPTHAQRWCYAAAKQLLERFIFALHKEMGLPFTIVRPFNFFGPRMDFIPGRDGEGVPRVLACFLTALLDDEPLKLVNGGHNRRTIVSIHDAIDALILMLERPDKSQNQIFNVGNRENEVSIAELARLIREVYSEVSGDAGYLKHPIQEVSSEEFYGEGYEDSDRRMPNLDKAKVLLGWAPRVPLRDILIETVGYYHERYGKTEPASARAVSDNQAALMPK